MKKYYYVIEAPGCYGLEGPARISRHLTRAAAEKAAAKATEEYRRAMRPYGGSSGGYIVSETDGDHC